MKYKHLPSGIIADFVRETANGLLCRTHDVFGWRYMCYLPCCWELVE